MKSAPLFFFFIFFSISYAQNKKVDLTPYWHEMHLATDAKNKNDIPTRNQHLINAFGIVSEIDITKMYSTHFLKLIEIFALESIQKADSFISNTPVPFTKEVLQKPISQEQNKVVKEFLTKRIDSLLVEMPLEKYKHPKCDEIYEQLDYLMDLDQKIRSKEWKENFESKEAREEQFLKINTEVNDSLFNLFEVYGLFGMNSCDFDIKIVLVHTDNYEVMKSKKEMLIDLVKGGYLFPEAFTWAYDRSYSQANGDFYYHFCLNHPFNDTNYITPEKLPKEQQETINQRRKEIGIPPLPYDFGFISF